MKTRIFAVYKGEELLADGTIEEIAEQLNIKPASVLFYRTPSWIKRTTEKNARRLIFLYNEEDEEV